MREQTGQDMLGDMEASGIGDGDNNMEWFLNMLIIMVGLH